MSDRQVPEKSGACIFLLFCSVIKSCSNILRRVLQIRLTKREQEVKIVFVMVFSCLKNKNGEIYYDQENAFI